MSVHSSREGFDRLIHFGWTLIPFFSPSPPLNLPSDDDRIVYWEQDLNVGSVTIITAAPASSTSAGGAAPTNMAAYAGAAIAGAVFQRFDCGAG